MNTQVADVYKTLGWIINSSDEGMFFLIAREEDQRAIIRHYKKSNIAVYDYREHPGIYSFNRLEQWFEENGGARVFFLLNLHLALLAPKDAARFGAERLNFSRDMLMRLHKNIVFCVTEYAENIIMRKAPDLYSFKKLRMAIDAKPKVKETEAPQTAYDLSTGDDEGLEVDFTRPERVLLSKSIAFLNKANELQTAFRYKDALLNINKAKEIHERLLGGEHPDTARTYGWLGFIYIKLNQYDEAVRWWQKAVNIQKKTLGNEHPETARSYYGIGFAYYNQENIPKALEYYQKALTIEEKVLGKEHPDTASSYNNIGAAYDSQGDYPKALEFYEKAFAIREKALGKEHPDTAISYNNIGAAYASQGDYPKALEFYEKALAIREKAFGKEHPTTAISYNNIGYAYFSQGDYPKALEYSQKALTIREKVLGVEHPNTSTSYENIGVIYQYQGDYLKAVEYLKKALEINEKVLGREHPSTKSTRGDIEKLSNKIKE